MKSYLKYLKINERKNILRNVIFEKYKTTKLTEIMAEKLNIWIVIVGIIF